VLLHQQELKLGWGKAVAMPSTPLFAGTATAHAPVKGEQLRCIMIVARQAPRSARLPIHATHCLRSTGHCAHVRLSCS
jgi:hypothetical protein